MQKSNKVSSFQITSSLLMMLSLLWLCISTPFVYAAQQHFHKAVHNKADIQNEEVPLSSNTTEEKSETGIGTISEYLHELLHENRPFVIILKYYKCHSADVYLAFHPQLISPPPEV